MAWVGDQRLPLSPTSPPCSAYREWRGPCKDVACSGLGMAGHPGLTHSCSRCPASPRQSACARRPRWPAQMPSASRSCCIPGISFWHPCRGASPSPPRQAGGKGKEEGKGHQHSDQGEDREQSGGRDVAAAHGHPALGSVKAEARPSGATMN